MFPLISVIIPTYNYAQYIIEAINSVLQQDYPKDKIEIIVIDDGSTDNTKQVLQNFIDNKTIQYHYQQNEGKASTTYKAIQHAGGKYIFNLDADDYFLPDKIKRTVAIFESDENIVHVASPAKIFDEKTKTIPGSETLPQKILDTSTQGQSLLNFFYSNNIFYGSGSTYAAKASVLKQVDIPAAIDMYIDEFLVLAVLPFGKSYFIADALSVWRIHGNNYSSNASKYIQITKAKRLLSSSDALLDYLTGHKYDKNIVDIYKLKNLTAHISFKELAGRKSFSDIAKYTRDVFFSIKPGFHLVKQYHVLNRLIPTPLFKIMKNMFKRKPAGSLPSVPGKNSAIISSD
jgi:glycosyltransferase involved in cell wall biosynthesis